MALATYLAMVCTGIVAGMKSKDKDQVVKFSSGNTQQQAEAPTLAPGKAEKKAKARQQRKSQAGQTEVQEGVQSKLSALASVVPQGILTLPSVFLLERQMYKCAMMMSSLVHILASSCLPLAHTLEEKVSELVKVSTYLSPLQQIDSLSNLR